MEILIENLRFPVSGLITTTTTTTGRTQCCGFNIRLCVKAVTAFVTGLSISLYTTEGVKGRKYRCIVVFSQ